MNEVTNDPKFVWATELLKLVGEAQSAQYLADDCSNIQINLGGMRCLDLPQDVRSTIADAAREALDYHLADLRNKVEDHLDKISFTEG